jgi:peptide/nickel transport system permease protein
MTAIMPTGSPTGSAPARPAAGQAPAGVGPGTGMLRPLIHRPTAVAAFIVLLAIIISCAAAPWIAPYHPDVASLSGALSGPSARHWLGTDELGRDILSRLIYGGRPALLDALLVVAVTLGIGVPAGMLAGLAGGWIDRLTMQVADVGLALPTMVIVLVVLSVFQGKLQIAMIVLGVLLVPPLVRIMRAAALAVRAELYVDAAKVSGVPTLRIVFRHVLPRVRGTILVQASLVAALSLLFTTGLAFLGFGTSPPNPSWGSMTAEASQTLTQSPWLLIASGGVIGVTVLCLGLLGDGIRDVTVGSWTGSMDGPTARSRRRPARASASAGAGTGTGTVGVTAAGAAADTPDPEALLSIRGLTVSFPRDGRDVAVVSGVSLDIRADETVGLVGESGCGKTSVARSVIGLLRGGGHVAAGRIIFDGHDVTDLRGQEARKLRGGQIALIAQEPMAALDPTCRVGALLAQAVRCHQRMPGNAARQRVLELLRMARLADPERVARSYPHELSGGMAQRVAVARALAGRPRLLIADEPTTALDVTLQAEILALLRSLQQETGMAILIVSHDWGVVAELCDRAVVMYAGQVVEEAPVADLFAAPAHPYTRLLLAASPGRAADGAARLPTIPGTIPAPEDWPAACHFGQRCPHATDACAARPIPLEEIGTGWRSRCIRTAQLTGPPSHQPIAAQP